MKPEVFRDLQSSMGMKNADLAQALGVAEVTVIRWRTGWSPIPGPVGRLMLMLCGATSMGERA